MADTLMPCRCISSIITSSPNRITGASPCRGQSDLPVLTSPDASKPIVALTLRKIQSAQLGRIQVLPQPACCVLVFFGSHPHIERVVAVIESHLCPNAF